MSGIDELKQELADRAAALPVGHHTKRMAGIKRKRAAQRRMTVGGVAAGAALAVAAAVALIPGSTTLADPRTPVATRPSDESPAPDPKDLPGAPIPVVEQGGVEFYETPGLAQLSGYAVGEPGQRRLEFSFVADSDVVTYSSACYGGSEAGIRLPKGLFVNVEVNGSPLSARSCASGPPTVPQSPNTGFGGPHENQAGTWSEYGVRRGATVAVVVELVDAEDRPASDADVVLGAGFWSVPVPGPDDMHDVAPSVTEPDIVEYQGVNYEFVTSVSGLRGPGQPLGALAHQLGSPVLLRWGTDSGGIYTIRSGDRLTPESVQTASGPAAGGGYLIPSGDTSEVSVTGRQLRQKQAQLWIALYEPIQ